MNNTHMASVGIDVSKDKLDVCLLKANDKTVFKTVSNDMKGFKQMLAWIEHAAPAFELHYALEATGTYSNAVAQFLVQNELKVSVVNPALTHSAATTYKLGNRTDHTMCFAIAKYCRHEKPALWKMARPEIRKLDALVRRREDLKITLVQEENRLKAPDHDKEVTRSIQKSLSFLTKAMMELDKKIEDHIENTPSLKADAALLESIPGIGALTASAILAKMPDVADFKEASYYAAFAGLAPYEQSSGSSVYKQTHISRQGSRQMRSLMYWPAISATMHNSLVKSLYDRLRAKGRPKMVGICAAMRKLLLLAFGVLKNRQKFDENWGVKSETLSEA